jgi:tRNA(Ile)-lysidine synthase
MVLFDLISNIHPKINCIVAHFDHSLRGAESDYDRELVANICNKENINFEYQKMDIGSMAKSENMNIEAIARRERYAFLESVRSRY